MKKIRRYIIDENGKKRWYSGNTEKEAFLAYKKLEEKLAKESMMDTSILFRDWVEKWASAYRRHESRAQQITTERRMQNYVYPYIGSKPMVKIKPIDIQFIFSQTTDKSYSFNHKLYVTLNQIFNKAIDNEIIIKSPMRGVDKPKNSKSSKNRMITEEERQKLLNSVDNSSDSMLFLMSLYCGLRPGETVALKWSDIDLKNRVISVNKALKDDNIIGPPKTTAGTRKVPIPDAFYDYLVANKSTGYVCLNHYGERFTKTVIQRSWRRTRKKAGLPKELTLYSLRHTYCTDLETAGVPINIAKIFMGHESIKITAGIYTHTQDAAIKDAIAKINQKSTSAEQINTN